MELDHNTRIRAQNDAFRQCPDMAIPYGIDGTIVTTRGVIDLFGDRLDTVTRWVRTYTTFTEDNDPEGTHDFGAFKIGAQRLFWKIDYYADASCTYGSEDPADPTKTFRVLTVMLAEEY